MKSSQNRNLWKSVGLLANTAEGAAICYREMVHKAALFTQDLSHPEIILHQFSFPRYKRAMEQLSEGNPKELQTTLLEGAEKLKNAGAEFIIIPANTPHLIYDEFSKHSPLPSISIVDSVSTMCQKNQFVRPLVLGTLWTMKNRLYRSSGDSQALYQHPHDRDQQIVHQIIMDELLKGIVTESSRKVLYRLVERNRDENQVDSVVLGCTELPMIFETSSPLPYIDSNLALVMNALTYAFQGNF